MNKTIFTIIILLLLGLAGHSQHTLKIIISGLESNKGEILLDFRNSEDETIKGFIEKISDNKCEITIEDLQTGTYAFKYFHDENSNQELDTNWLGIPKEGIGFSNDAKGKFGPPDFKDTLFEVNKDTTMECTAIYLNF
jgi:uncharacterized protein (DUF2141 family)